MIVNKRLFFLFLLFFSKILANQDILTVAGGMNGLFHPKYRSFEFYLEYKWNDDVWKISPVVGAMSTSKGSFYGYGGFELNIHLDSFEVNPSFAAGGYIQGGGKNLGYPLEFRSGVRISYVLQNNHRIGLHFYHISNASFGNRNPGEESLLLCYSIPILRFKGSRQAKVQRN